MTPPEPSRRAVLKATAWSLPVVAVAASVPLAAASNRRARVIFDQAIVEVPLADQGAYVPVLLGALLVDADDVPFSSQVEIAFSDPGFGALNPGNLLVPSLMVTTPASGRFWVRTVVAPGVIDGATAAIQARVWDGDWQTETDAAMLRASVVPRLSLSRYFTYQVLGGYRSSAADVTATQADFTGSIDVTFHATSGVFAHAIINSEAVPSTGWTISGEGTDTVIARYTGTILRGTKVIAGVELTDMPGVTGTVAVSNTAGAPTVPPQPLNVLN